MLSAYMQEVDIKVLLLSIYFTYICVSDFYYAEEISASSFVDVSLAWYCQKHSITPNTHTHIILS